MSERSGFDKRQYRDAVDKFKERFRQEMLNPRTGLNENPANVPSWNTIDLWATAIMMDEALTLSRLTRVLIFLTAILAVLTGVLVFRTL